MKLLLEFISAFVLSAVQVYAWYKITNTTFKGFNFKRLIFIIILSLFSIINFKSVNPFIKSITMIIVAIYFCKILLKESIKNSIIIVCIDYFLIIISEALFGFLLILLSKSSLNYLWSTYSGSILADFCICILIILIVQFKFINNLYRIILKHTSYLKNYQILIFLLIIISCSGSGFVLIYYRNNILFAIILNTLISFIYAIVIFLIIKTKNKYILINNKYRTSLDSLQAQEQIINDYRILNHENRNQLLTIKSMTKNKKVTKYIDSLISSKIRFCNQIIDATLQLPEGGIKGLIYQKMIYMKEHNIVCNLNVDKQVTPKILANIDDNDIVDICQILGVIIDNAIEAQNNLEDKIVNIQMSVIEEKLVINISNIYNQDINTKKNTNIIKTTKGKGHGYGLQLVERIIANNKKISNNRIITKNNFTQIVNINI